MSRIVSVWKHSALVALAVFAGVCLAQPVLAGDVPGIKNARAGDKEKLDHFQEIDSQFYFGMEFPTDVYGNSVAERYVLFPTPGDGSGTAASVSVTLKAGEPFFIPLLQLFGTGYNDGTPDDPLESIDVFKTLEITFKIDGKVIINQKNALHYLSQFYFDPEIPVDFDPIDAVVWFQGIGYASTPLPVGKHKITLHVKNTQPVFGSQFLEYNNTWSVTVKK